MRSRPDFLSPTEAVNAVEPGPWGVAVSGGADSTALLRLTADCPHLQLHVIHLDHQTRGDASAGDAEFVARLATDLGLACTLRTRAEVESAWPADSPRLPANPSARYRALRLAIYHQTVVAHRLQGVLLAHHADDQAETVLLRLLRGVGYPALSAMRARSVVDRVLLRRPLLNTRRELLRLYLSRIGQPWREDSSNASGDYARNRVRITLAGRDDLVSALLDVSVACRALSDWVDEAAPVLPPAFETAAIADLPELLARSAATDWLRSVGVSPDDVSPAHVSALLNVCRDAASVPRYRVPGGIEIVRRRGVVSARQVP